MTPGTRAEPDHAGIGRLLAPLVGQAGFDLERVEVAPAGRRRLLRVVVDKDGGVSLDDVADLSRQLSEALDTSGVMGDAPYLLEITSPGVERPLAEPRHWRRAVDRLVEVRLDTGDEVTGRVVAADESGVVLDVEGAHERHAYAELSTARVQVEFRRRERGVS